MTSIFQYPIDLSKQYNLPLQNWSKIAWKKFKDHQIAWLTLYNIKSNTVWFAAGFIIGSIGVAYIEKNRPEWYQKLHLSDEQSLVLKAKKVLNHQNEGIKFVIKVVAVTIIFTPYFPLEGLVLGFLSGEHALWLGRKYEESKLDQLKIQISEETKPEVLAKHFYELAKTLNGQPITLQDDSVVGKKEAILRAIHLDDTEPQYFAFLAGIMDKQQSIQLLNKTKITYQEAIQKAQIQ